MFPFTPSSRVVAVSRHDQTRLCHPQSTVHAEYHRERCIEARAQPAAAAPRYDRCAITQVPRYARRSEEHTSELQSLMRISYAVFCLKNKTTHYRAHTYQHT